MSSAMQVDGAAAAPQLDLDAVAARYTGWPKVMRLRFVALKSAALAPKALLMALQEIKAHTTDVAAYEAVMRMLAGMGAAQPPDAAWEARAQKSTADKRKAVEQELTVQLGQAIRESIRRCYLDKALCELERGDFISAKGTLLRAREYTANLRQTTDLSLALVDLALLTKDWDGVKGGMMRPELGPSSEFAAQPSAAARLAVASGLNALHEGRFADAADRLLSYPASLAASGLNGLPGGATAGTDVPVLELAHPEDVAPAAILAALASYSRPRLAALASAGGSSKALLEASPGMRDVLLDMVAGRHAAALAGVGRLRKELELDWGMGGAVDRCIAEMRRHCLEWHMAPYSALSLTSMAETFATPLASLEGEVAGLIKDGRLVGRIDGVSKVYRSKVEDPRAGAAKALKEAKAALTAEARVVLLKAALETKGEAASRGGMAAAGGARKGNAAGANRKALSAAGKGTAGGQGVGPTASAGSAGTGGMAATASQGSTGGGSVTLPGQVEGGDGDGGDGGSVGSIDSVEMATGTGGGAAMEGQEQDQAAGQAPGAEQQGQGQAAAAGGPADTDVGMASEANPKAAAGAAAAGAAPADQQQQASGQPQGQGQGQGEGEGDAMKEDAGAAGAGAAPASASSSSSSSAAAQQAMARPAPAHGPTSLSSLPVRDIAGPAGALGLTALKQYATKAMANLG